MTKFRYQRLFLLLGLAAGVLLLFLIHEVLALIAVGGIAYSLLRRRITQEQERLFLALAAAGFMLLLSGFGPAFIIVLLGLTYLLLRFATEPLSRFIARLGYGIRWKFETALSAIAGLFLIVSLIGLGAMDSMHTELHAIQNLGPDRQLEILAAVNELEDTRHTLLSTLTPALSFGGVLISAALGAAMARSVIDPVDRMAQAMRRIATGNFSEPVHVENRDELGELASSVNQTAGELARLQEATLTEERARALQERITQVTLAQEEERRRISRELHDGLGPSLAAIGNRLSACQYMVSSDPEQAKRELGEVTKTLKGHIQEIRELAHDLRPLALDQLGLIGALSQHVERFGQETGIAASFSTSGKVALNPLVEVTIFLVIQECLSNIQKHANATQVEVRLQGMDAGVEVKVQDNGRGFDPYKASPTTTGRGVGLLGMQERAELLGGSLSVQSSVGSGCLVTLFVPSKEVEVGADTNPDR